MLLECKRNKDNMAVNIIEEESDDIINKARELIDYNYHYEVKNIDEEINKYIEKEIKKEILCI